MKIKKAISNKKAALAMAVLMTLCSFNFVANPVFAEATDKPVRVLEGNAKDYENGIFVSNANAGDDLVYIGASDFKTTVVNVADSVTTGEKAVNVEAFKKLVANQGVTVSDITFLNARDSHGMDITGGTVEAPTIRINNLRDASANNANELVGLVAATLSSWNKETLKADSIYVGNIKSDKSEYVNGVLFQGALWQSFNEGKDNNLTIENINGGAENAVVGGIEVGFATSKMSDSPYNITGDTVISNIKSDKGSAYGIMASSSSGANTNNTYIHMRNLKISDIHGKDLSFGIFGLDGDIIADNADINMTGKDGYNGLYTEPMKDAKKAEVNSFAVSDSFIGNVKLDNAEGKYNIHGDILADRVNYNISIEATIKKFKEKVKGHNPDWTEEQVEEFTNTKLAYLVNKLKNFGHINLGGKLALYGDVYAKRGGNVSINLTKGSIFEGQADNYADYDTIGSLVWRKADLDALLNLPCINYLTLIRVRRISRCRDCLLCLLVKLI